MKQPKWIESIEVTDYWQPGFWVDRGWDKDARVKATSVIDTVAVDMTILNADHRRLAPVRVESRGWNCKWMTARGRKPHYEHRYRT